MRSINLLQSLDCYDMEGSASTNLAHIALLQNDTSGMHYARRAYEYGVKTNEVHYSYSALNTLAEFAIMNGDFEAANSYLNQAKEIAVSSNYEDKEHAKLIEATILTNTGKTAESTAILKEIKSAIESKLPIYLPDLFYLMGQNYHSEGQYQESNKALLEAVEAAKRNSSTPALGKIYKLIADNYSAMGLDSQALPYMRNAFDQAETSGQTDRQRMINERKLTLDVIHQDQKRKLAEEKARYTGRLSVFLGLLLVLASATIIIVISNLRKRNRLYRHIVQQNVAMLKEEEKYKSRILELESSSVTQQKMDTGREIMPSAENPEKPASMPAATSATEEDKKPGGPSITEEKFIKIIQKTWGIG